MLASSGKVVGNFLWVLEVPFKILNKKLKKVIFTLHSSIIRIYQFTTLDWTDVNKNQYPNFKLNATTSNVLSYFQKLITEVQIIKTFLYESF